MLMKRCKCYTTLVTLPRSPAQPHLAALEQVLNLWSLTSAVSFYVSINYTHIFLYKNIMFY